jgi:Ca2+-transporting ATPase
MIPPGSDSAAEAHAVDAQTVDAHAQPAAAVAARLGVDPALGLASADAAGRLVEGRNELEPQRAPSLLSLLLESATEPFVLMLFGSGLLAILVGEVRDGLLILAGLVPIVGADVVTEFRAERALESLRAAAAPTAVVRRNGRPLEIPAAEVVRGDLVLLRAGDVVAADLRIVEAEGLLLDRSILTGESAPDLGQVAPDAADAGPADRHAIAYAGSGVVGGRGAGVAVATGPRTAFGRIAASMGEVERRRSPLQRELDRIVRILLVVALGLVAIVAGHGMLVGRSLGENVLAGIAAAIAAIPEEPPVLLAVILGLGAYRLLRRGVLVRRLSAQETLGAIDLIVTDKTGTLTVNRLELTAVATPDGRLADSRARTSLVAAAGRAEADTWAAEGSGRTGAFAGALLRELQRLEVEPVEARAALVSATPPADGRPYSETVTRVDGRLERQILGAPEAVLGACELADRAGWQALVSREADAGGRLLLLARAIDDGPLEPAGLFVFADPLRSGVAEALALARQAGIQTIVVTGDHERTAAAIARAAGVGAQRVVSGRELATWSDERLLRELPNLRVVARALPEQKLQIVNAARAAQRTVAVTGDGVNDGPALQHADVAVAMGSGVAVAKGAADLVLGDDSFATLLGGLREGRRIVANVQKGLVFLLSTHVALLGFILVATLAGFDQPLLPLQILWLELFIDLSTSVAFEREPEEPGAMARPPQPRNQPLLDRGLLARIAAAGGFSAVAAFVLMALHGGTAEHARWLAFTTLVLAQAVRAYGNRSLTTPVSKLPPNRLLVAACLTVVAVQLLMPLVPPLAEAFRATPLDGVDLATALAIALTPSVAADVVRRSGRRWVA